MFIRKILAANSPLRLSELTQQIQQALDGVFYGRTFWVIADVSNYTFKADTGYHYFELVEKDKTSSRLLGRIAARAWGNASVNISNFERVTGQRFKSDIQVLVQVSVQYNPAFGLQLNLIDIDTNFTLGQFEQQRKATLERLLRDNPEFIRKAGDGYETRNSLLNLNKVIQHIAIISSDTSAGYQDFRHTLENNPFGYQYHIDDYFTKVQGEENAKAFLERLIEIFNSGKPYDAVIIIRGGGAQTDFLMFDNYELSRAIAKFPVPVITGIGHQKNETIADLMSHTSTKTPTKAAEWILAHNRGFEERILGLQNRILIKTQQLFSQHSNALSGIRSYLIRDVMALLNGHHQTIRTLSGLITAHPKFILNNKRKDLGNIQINIKSYNRIYFLNKQTHLDHYQSLVRLMSPQNILNKGFAIVKLENQIINNADLIEPGQELKIQLSKTEIHTIVQSKENI